MFYFNLKLDKIILHFFMFVPRLLLRYFMKIGFNNCLNDFVPLKESLTSFSFFSKTLNIFYYLYLKKKTNITE